MHITPQSQRFFALENCYNTVMSEKENMLSGLFYNASDPELVAARLQTRLLLRKFNNADPADEQTRTETAAKLFGAAGKNLHIEAPFYCDYGSQIYFGDNVYINFNCTILDCARVDIGSGTLIGPSVQIYTATHPVDPTARAEGKEFAVPVSIGRNVWLGGGCIILPGVKIGDGAVIGAGAVVKHDIPPFAVAAGNPARVKRQFYDFKKQI